MGVLSLFLFRKYCKKNLKKLKKMLDVLYYYTYNSSIKGYYNNNNNIT